MPIMWVEPELFLEHKEVRVYHVYKDDDMSQGTRTYYYGYTIHCSENEDSFDIRYLSNYKKGVSHGDILTEAIDQGILTNKGIMRK